VAETQLPAREEAVEKGTEPVRVRFCFNRVITYGFLNDHFVENF
jgi:hypothetical protein